MDKLPHPLLLQILSQLDDSADVASCRVASKAFDTVFSDLRSINLPCSSKWHLKSNSSTSPHVKLFKAVFHNLISKQNVVESVCIGPETPLICACPDVDRVTNDLYLTDGDFVQEWLPRVSESLKSLSISDLRFPNPCRSNVLPLISAYCHNLVNLSLKSAWLVVDNLNPMSMLTSLTLAFTKLEDEDLSKLNKCFPNLQVLNLIDLEVKDLNIHFPNLKTCRCIVFEDLSSLTLNTPNLITLEIKCMVATTIHVEAPMLSHFHLALYDHHASTFIKKFENLKTLWIKSNVLGSLISQFLITKTVQNLTLDIPYDEPRDSKLTLVKVFTVFPNISSLRIQEYAWSLLEACLNPEDWEILDGRKGLKTFCAYLKLVDPSLTFSYVARVLDQCVNLLEVSLLISDAVLDTVSKRFMSKCMARWPELKWRWGIWGEDVKDSWITDH